jgi:ribosomal protein L29
MNCGCVCTGRQELFNLRQQWYAGSLEDPNVMRKARKDIARILTLVHERDLRWRWVKEEARHEGAS